MSGVESPVKQPAQAPVAPPRASNSGDIDGCATSKLPTNGSTGLDAIKGADAQSSFREQLLELQSWEQPANSALVLVSGAALFYLTSGEDGYALLTLVCYAVLLRLAVVAGGHYLLAATEGQQKLRTLRNMLDKACVTLESWLQIPSPELVANVTHGIASVVEAKTNSVCKALAQATEPTKEGRRLLKIVLTHMAVLMLLVNLFAARTLMFMYFCQQLIWPATYARFKAQVDDAYTKAWTHAQPHVDALSAKAHEAYGKVEAQAAGAVEAVKAKVQDAAEKAKAKPKPAAGEDSNAIKTD